MTMPDPSPEDRAKEPNGYWCIREEGKPAEYYWHEEPVSREEYLKFSGKPDCEVSA